MQDLHRHRRSLGHRPGHRPARGPGGKVIAITRELELKGSFRFNDETDDVIAAPADGSLQIDPVITHDFPMEQALVAFEVARNSAESGKVLLSFGPGKTA